VNQEIPPNIGDAQAVPKREFTVKHALLAIAFNVFYIWTIFVIGLAGVVIYNIIFPINFSSIIAVSIVAAIFGIITAIDFTLLYFEKVTPVMILWVCLLAIPLALYLLIVGAELFKIDNKKMPTEAKELLFRRKKFC
jgi:hypothetical protein